MPIPACLIVDDFPFNASSRRRAQYEAFGYPIMPGPWARGWRRQGKATFMSVALLERFADLVEQYGIRGKLTVLPAPGGWGRMDQSVRNLPEPQRLGLLKIVRDRLQRRFDITPEVLTHTFALDLSTGGLLPHTETAWLSHLASEGRTEDLCAYLRRAWEILTNLGLMPAGTTVGGMEDVSGIGGGRSLLRNDSIECFSKAVSIVRREFDPRATVSFVFTGGGPTSEHSAATWAPEKLATSGRLGSVYGIFSTDDILLSALNGHGTVGPLTDQLISRDLESGELVDHAESGKALMIGIHSCTMESLNTALGFEVLRQVIGRLHERYGRRLRWMTPMEMIAKCHGQASAGPRPSPTRKVNRP